MEQKRLYWLLRYWLLAAEFSTTSRRLGYRLRLRLRRQVVGLGVYNPQHETCIDLMAACIGIDIGTSGTKALVINPRGKILAEASASYLCHHPKPLWSEQDPDDWWKGTVKAVRAVVKRAKLKAADVGAIGLSGQMHGSVFLDRQNRVVRPAMLWNDQRTEAECAEIEQRAGGRKRLIKLVANPALTGFTAPKILWLRNHEPRHFDRTAKVLLPKDEIRDRKSTRLNSSHTDISRMPSSA